MTLHEAFTNWKETFQTEIPADDIPMNSESWNNYTDSLCKDGELTDLQYHYCPAYDDPIPGDADSEREYILDQLEVRISWESATPRAGWPEGSNHYRVTITRGGEGATFSTPYTMGPALKGPPTREDVLHSLISDASLIWDGATDALDLADETGMELDTHEKRQEARAMFDACKTTAEELEHMFRDVSTDDLRELFADY